MTLKHLFTTLTIVCCTLLGFTACNDEDYAPIQLQAQNNEIKIDNNILKLDAFNPGESFVIIGGNGRYVIENKNENIVDYRYDGNALKIIPQGIGTATIIIRDHAGNRMTLTIEIANPTSSFTIVAVEAQAYGDDMTGSEMKILEKRMVDESLIKVSGDILLTYTNKECTLGSITIHPTASGRPVVGTFKKEIKSSGNNVPYQELEVRLADNRLIVWHLLNYTEEADKEMLLQEDVTATYKGAYTTLEEAKLIYTITH